MSTRLDESEAWQAVVDRDSRFDGRLLYAVRTTGIYCRPGCPARRPRRENVSFFATPALAEHAGFRACQRCHPDGRDPQLEVIAAACRFIDANAERRVTLAELGAQVGMSPGHLQRTFKRVTGATPREYAAAGRSGRLREALRQGTHGTRAVFEAGFGSTSSAYASSDAFLGMTPASYARGGSGITIRYGFTDTALGRLLVARTERGVCSIALGDSDRDLHKGLEREFEEATLVRDDAGLAALCDALAVLADGRAETVPELGLDVRATEFQWQVWRALRAIPRGSTSTYTQVAAAIGRPSATRAVARACATNPVALVVPCHRVIRGDGDLAGYRWGVERKQQLLARESEPA